MIISNIEQLEVLLKEFYNAYIDDNGGVVVTCGDDTYWIIPIIDVNDRIKDFFEEIKFQEFEEGLFIGRSNIELDDDFFAALHEATISDLWRELINVYCKFRRSLDKVLLSNIFIDTYNHLGIISYWRAKPCKSRTDVQSFVTDLNILFRECIKYETKNKNYTSYIKGLLKENSNFYQIIFTLRNFWAAHSINHSQYRDRIHEVESVFLQLIGKQDLEDDICDCLNLQIKLLEEAIEAFEKLQNDERFFEYLKNSLGENDNSG